MKPVTLKLNKEFRRAYGRGRSFVAPALVTYVLPNRQNRVRVGVTTGKKVGCAVKRNRARRVIMAAFRAILPDIRAGYDIVFVARARTPEVKSGECLAAMRRHLGSAGVLL